MKPWLRIACAPLLRLKPLYDVSSTCLLSLSLSLSLSLALACSLSLSLALSVPLFNCNCGAACLIFVHFKSNRLNFVFVSRRLPWVHSTWPPPHPPSPLRPASTMHTKSLAAHSNCSRSATPSGSLLPPWRPPTCCCAPRARCTFAGLTFYTRTRRLRHQRISGKNENE